MLNAAVTVILKARGNFEGATFYDNMGQQIPTNFTRPRPNPYVYVTGISGKADQTEIKKRKTCIKVFFPTKSLRYRRNSPKALAYSSKRENLIECRFSRVM